ncbi:T9SS type A sorting domain-containing protein [Flavicella marina]|uniref:T9SS type A sorting domain-containing protein n=1 Tax=Flavicella marina TaxID=1475951 RepID=UPI00186AD6D4|nr:T9SS type A sorting domain-containing protein [Flavicella marina]
MMLTFLSTQNLCGQTENEILAKITELESLISDAENKQLDATKEKMTISVAQVFLKYANWDENNIDINQTLFASLAYYKDDALQLAQDLPDLERSDILIILDEAIIVLQKIIAGEIKRKSIPQIDWSNLTISDNKILQNGTPVFLTDYTWKPYIPELTKYFGARDGFYLSPTFADDENGTIKSYVTNNLNNKSTGTFGNIFINHKSTPDWAEQQYGPGFRMREDTFVAYDIDNPGAKTLFSSLFQSTIPKIAGKNYAQLGYMLANEPHFITTKEPNKNVWASGPVSEHTIEKFKLWLTQKHQTIDNLNLEWGTNFADFPNVTIDIPIFRSLQGTPMWYDWQRFNMDRVNDWFQFLQNEIKIHDPSAKTHIKLIPHFWVQNQGDHGLDIETLTRQSDILGNDAQSYNSHMWGPKEDWEDRYNFEWKDIALTYDFFSSISPNKIIFNSETHFLSTTKFRDLYLKPSYARMTYWLAYLHGLNVDQCWFWSRREDGSPRGNMVSKDYPGSINQQPQILNEVTSTMMDLNSYSQEITQIQNLPKPIRIFNTQTSAINVGELYMKNTFNLYESLYFEGLQLGFATKDIINLQDNNLWEVILIANTEFVTEDELDALQNYLNQGGHIIVDAISLKKNEYGKLHTKNLEQGSGMLETASSIEEMKNRALEVINTKKMLPVLTVEETNSLGLKGCHWRSIVTPEGKNIISLVNIGKTQATIKLGFYGSDSPVICTNLLNGYNLTNTFLMEPEQVLFLEVTAENDHILSIFSETCPDANNGKLKIKATQVGNYKLTIGNQETLFSEEITLEGLAPDNYKINIINLDKQQLKEYSFIIKKSNKLDAVISTMNNKTIFDIVEGTAPYHVFINEQKVFSTDELQFSLETQPEDALELTSDAPCEGKISMTSNPPITIYPNPTSSLLRINNIFDEAVVQIYAYDIQGRLILTRQSNVTNTSTTIDISDLTNGVYFIKIPSKNSIFKLIKKQ